MRYLLFSLFLLPALALGRPPGVCVQDDLNQPVCIHEPRRVLVLAPHLTEIVDFAGGLDRVMAVDAASDFPPATGKLQKITAPWLLGAESILARKPDLVLAWQSGMSAGVIEQLRKAGLAVFVSEPKSVSQVASTMRRVAQLLGTSPETEPKVEAWLAQFQQIRLHYQGRKPVTVFYQVWNQPLMTLGGTHVVSEIISLCGGHNVYAEIKNLAAQVSMEGVLKRKPAVLLTSGSPEKQAQFIQQWAAWPQIPAVRLGQVHTLPADILVRSGPRLLDATRMVCAHLDAARQGVVQQKGSLPSH